MSWWAAVVFANKHLRWSKVLGTSIIKCLFRTSVRDFETFCINEVNKGSAGVLYTKKNTWGWINKPCRAGNTSERYDKISILNSYQIISYNQSSSTSVWVVTIPTRNVCELRSSFSSQVSSSSSEVGHIFSPSKVGRDQIKIHLQSQEQSPGSSRFQFLKSQQPKHLTHKMIATIRDTTWPSQDRSISILLWSSYRTGRCTVSKNLRDLQMFPLKTSFPDFFRDVCLDSFGPTKSGTCRVPFFAKNQGLGEWKLRPRRSHGVSSLKEVCILQRNGNIQFFTIILLLEILRIHFFEVHLLRFTQHPSDILV